MNLTYIRNKESENGDPSSWTAKYNENLADENPGQNPDAGLNKEG